MPSENDEFIGPSMKSNRLADGIEAPVVMRALDVNDTDELSLFESDPNPPADAVRAYAKACRDAYDRSGALMARPAAAREQYYTTAFDHILTNHCQLQNRPVRWWWARRVATGGAAPMCYVCGRNITDPRSDVVLSDAERDAVMEHRMIHLRAYEVTTMVTPIVEPNRV